MDMKRPVMVPAVLWSTFGHMSGSMVKACGMRPERIDVLFSAEMLRPRWAAVRRQVMAATSYGSVPVTFPEALIDEGTVEREASRALLEVRVEAGVGGQVYAGRYFILGRALEHSPMIETSG